MKQKKLMTAEQAAALISDNSSILLFDGYEPVSLIRELLQQNRRRLTLFPRRFLRPAAPQTTSSQGATPVPALSRRRDAVPVLPRKCSAWGKPSSKHS